MKLYRLLDDVKNKMKFKYPFIEDCEIEGITDNSREVKSGFIFVCVKGAKFDGHNFASEMLEKGASVIICERDLGLENQITVENSREFYGHLCASWFGHPEEALKLVGVTGTNGKTTMATLIKNVLTDNGFKVGFIGTTGVTINGNPVDSDGSTPTTPRVFELYSLFYKMLRKGCNYVVMEVSSFALEQNRIGPACFDVGVFTNLTQDHLDYHETMENYYNAKKILFTNHCKFSIINTDDEYGRRLYNELVSAKIPAVSYGFDGKTYISADKIRAAAGVTKFWVSLNNKSYPVSLKMIGKYNVANAIAAIGVCLKLGININNVINSLGKTVGVKGRCEILTNERGFMVICDYAHSPDALENLLPNLREHTEGKLICLFGCGGNRDKTKRPLMGRAAEKYSDFLIITSDNPRDEDPLEIIGDITSGLEGEKKYICITNRMAAIKYAISIAKQGDVIVLAGKGHEDYQILENDLHIHFDEHEIVSEIMSNYSENRFVPNIKEEITLGDIIFATMGNGQGIRNESTAVFAQNIYSDSRKKVKNGVFVAIKGDNFDGHDYVQDAMRNGAIVAITERSIENYPCIIVKNTRKALLDLAYYFRKKFEPVLVGITGSVGKTTTKNMITLALSAEHGVYKTDGNHNNEIGLPFTLFGLNRSCTAAVIEMGMSHAGEIDRLSKTACPTVCVITNVGFSHIENFESQYDILSAKLEILNGASRNAPVVLNADDNLLQTAIKDYQGFRTIVTYGVQNKDADFSAENIKKYSDRVSFDIENGGNIIAEVVLYCKGRHNISNAVAAIAVAVTVGCDAKRAAEMLSGYQPEDMRQTVYRKGNHTIIADCYNASPASMKAAIDTLCEIESVQGRRVAVLGDMLELGEKSAELHREIGEYLVSKGINIIACYGKFSENIAKRAEELGVKSAWFMSKDELVNYLKYKLKPNDIILYKASRGMHLENVIEKFYKI